VSYHSVRSFSPEADATRRTGTHGAAPHSPRPLAKWSARRRFAIGSDNGRFGYLRRRVVARRRSGGNRAELTGLVVLHPSLGVATGSRNFIGPRAQPAPNETMDPGLKLPAVMIVAEFLVQDTPDGRRWQLLDSEPAAMAPASRTHGATQS
jgi:hypothetical protein